MRDKYRLKNRIYGLEDDSPAGLLKNAREEIEWVELHGYSKIPDYRLIEEGLMILFYSENSTNRESGNNGIRTIFFN